MNEKQKNKITELCCDTFITIKQVTESENTIIIFYDKKCDNTDISNFGVIKENGQLELLLSEKIQK